MKKDATIVIHLPESQQEQFRAIAAMEGTDMSGLGRNLIISFLADKQAQFESMREVFDEAGNVEN